MIRNNIYTKDVYDTIVSVVANTYDPTSVKLQPTQYQWIREFAVFDFNGNKVLAKKKMVEEYVKNHGQAHEHECPKYCYFEELFDALFSSHEAVGHAKVERTWKRIQHKFSNVSRKVVETFIDLCPLCSSDKVNNKFYIH
jgi:hypothetical protein